MRILWDFWRKRQELWLAWIAGLLLLLQVLNLHSYAVQAVDHQAIIASNDDDAAWNVRKAIKTRWWKDNGWILYGPAYFRLNHTVHYLWGRTADPHGDEGHEVWEKTAHHAILTISLLSLVGIALIIACQVLVPWWQRYLLTFGLLAAFCSIPAFAEFILRAHPDHLCGLVFVAAMVFTVRMMQEPKEKLWFWLAASLWGISVSVKMTLGLLVPGFFLLFVPPFKKANFVRGLKFLGAMFLAYFIIGLPQTIVLDRAFRMMAKVGSLNQPANPQTVWRWLELYGAQMAPLLAVAVLAVVDFKLRKWTLPKGQLWRLWAFVLLPFAVLLTQNPLIPSQHYTVNFLALLVLVLLMFWPFQWLNRFAKDDYPFLRAALFLTVILVAFGSTPKAMQVELEKRLLCREQARHTYARVKELYSQGKNIWVDPYVPYPTNAPESRVALSWEKSWQGYAQNDWQVLALGKSSINKFTAPDVDAYTRADIPGWEKAREFYMAFKEGDEARTPQGHVFRKIYDNSCGHELWLRQ